tara:strand:- start:2603 stop:2830 length:228 start_codon:yes stop_codon:yes gene_type:complete
MGGVSFGVVYLVHQMIHHVDYRVATTLGDCLDGCYAYERMSFHTANLAHNFYLSLQSWQHGRIITEKDPLDEVPF